MPHNDNREGSVERDLEELVNKNAIERIHYMLHRKRMMWSAISTVASFILSILSIALTQEYVFDFFKEVIGFLISDAHGEEMPAQGSSSQKNAMLGGIMVLICVLFIWALGAASLSRNTKTISLAHETIKTLTGFFIGILTCVAGK